MDRWISLVTLLSEFFFVLWALISHKICQDWTDQNWHQRVKNWNRIIGWNRSRWYIVWIYWEEGILRVNLARRSNVLVGYDERVGAISQSTTPIVESHTLSPISHSHLLYCSCFKIIFRYWKTFYKPKYSSPKKLRQRAIFYSSTNYFLDTK